MIDEIITEVLFDMYEKCTMTGEQEKSLWTRILTLIDETEN